MPSKNSVKLYLENGHYHIYNRGIDKRIIFLDEQDYRVFLHLLKVLLSPPSLSDKHPLTEITGFNPVRLRPILDTLYKEVDLLAYCLMPNHFHLLIKQQPIKAMEQFMRRLTISYGMYFNKKYKRVGHVFQDKFKAVNTKSNEQLMWSSSYIHMDPVKDKLVKHPSEYLWSSYNDFASNRNLLIVTKDLLTETFGDQKSFIKETLNFSVKDGP